MEHRTREFGFTFLGKARQDRCHVAVLDCIVKQFRDPSDFVRRLRLHLGPVLNDLGNVGNAQHLILANVCRPPSSTRRTGDVGRLEDNA